MQTRGTTFATAAGVIAPPASPNSCGITTVCPAATTSSANVTTASVIPGISCTTTTPGPVPLRQVGCVVPSYVWLPRVQVSSALMRTSLPRLAR